MPLFCRHDLTCSSALLLVCTLAVFQPPGLKEVAGSHVNALVQTISTTVTGGPLLVVRAGLPLRLDRSCMMFLCLI